MQTLMVAEVRKLSRTGETPVLRRRVPVSSRIRGLDFLRTCATAFEKKQRRKVDVVQLWM